ncbi:cysteine-rich CWC family protein [Inhella sp.]|uniref:cysteine-rich CWC family protein n=1 Tax=Inhella sp. TaxID=1921806 RepID=UPI0035ADAD91
MPSSTDNSRCPRCGGGFHCGAAEARCDCFELKLSPALRAELAQRYSGCLCLNCLHELAEPPQAPEATAMR